MSSSDDDADESARLLLTVPAPTTETNTPLDSPSTIDDAVGAVGDAVGRQLVATDDHDQAAKKHNKALDSRYLSFWILLISYAVVLFLNTGEQN